MKSVMRDLRGADFPGDEANLPGVNENPAPGLVVNPDASESELISSAIYRLSNALNLMWLVLDRSSANGGDEHIDGGIITLGRLCHEAKVLCEASMERLVEQTHATNSPKVKAGPG